MVRMICCSWEGLTFDNGMDLIVVSFCTAELLIIGKDQVLFMAMDTFG
jgi:hypothetical protein